MRIIDPSEKRRVALKLQEFIDNAIEMTQEKLREYSTPENAAFMAQVVKQMKSKSSNDDKASIIVSKVKNKDEARILLTLQDFVHFNQLKMSVSSYADGRPVKDILSDDNFFGKAVLGQARLEAAAPLTFADKQATEVMAITNVARNAVGRRVWKELGELVNVYSLAIRDQGEAARLKYAGDKSFIGYKVIDELSAHIEREHQILDREKSFDAPVKGRDYAPL